MKLIKISPPGFGLIYLLITLAFHFLSPQRTAFPLLYRLLGILGFTAGFSLMMWGWNLFKLKETSVIPTVEPKTLITTGPYRFSRNPMYGGMVLILLSIALFLGALFVLLAPLAFFLTLDRLFIPHEEKVMEGIFGKDYLDYKSRVRRWV